MRFSVPVSNQLSAANSAKAFGCGLLLVRRI